MDISSPILAFVAGILSILSPCVLPILPIVLGTAASSHRQGPLALAAGLSLSFVAVGLILATAGHVTPGATNNDDVDTTLLLDADLAILGAEPAAYQSYVNGVRAEYAHVDDEAWLTGRSVVLHRFLERPRLFATQYMHDMYEHRARANIQAELASLRRDG